MANNRLTTAVFLCGATLVGCGDNEIEPETESATSSALSLTGSRFEIDESANLVVNGASPAIDWASIANSGTAGESRRDDAPTGQTDNSYGGGAKEDDPCPTVGNGSIPNNKSDLKTFGVYIEPGTAANPAGFMHLFWSRVQDPTGTTLMDFEFNQSSTVCANGVNRLRTEGDFLLEYALDQGGATAEITLRTWTGTEWGPAADLTGTDAIGDINNTAIAAADADGLGALSARTFGEASIDLSVIFDSARCTSFGSAMVKSRASDSFTSALKDFIAPLAINLSNCGKVIIRKETVPDGLTEMFTFTPSISTDPALAAGTTFQLADGQNKEYANVLLGTGYTVDETIPAGYTLTSINCTASSGVTPTASSTATGLVTFNIDSVSDILDCTYTNTRNTGAILVTKTRKHAASGTGDHPHAGVSFTVNGVTRATDAFGKVCFDGLNFASYTVHEIVPAGYLGEDDKTVTVDNNATCSDNPYVGETVSFSNTPLTDITVTVNSQVNGGTASTIDCVIASASTNSLGDGSLAMTDLVPGTYVCTIVVDP